MCGESPLLRGSDFLSKEEAGGYWSPEVFQTTTLDDHNYSLTTWAVCWAGGINPQERGDLIKIAKFLDLAASVQKAACIQVIHDRDLFVWSLMLAPVVITNKMPEDWNRRAWSP